MRTGMFIVGLMALTLGGCANSVYVKSGATPQDFKRDQWDCENRVAISYGGWSRVEPFTAAMQIHECLESKGYEKIDTEALERRTVNKPAFTDQMERDLACRRATGKGCDS